MRSTTGTREAQGAGSSLEEIAKVLHMPRYGKVYAVWRGCNPGLYYSWVECEKHVKGFLGARCKSFKLWAEAHEWLNYIGN